MFDVFDFEPVSGKNHLSVYLNKLTGFKKCTDFSNFTKKARGGSSNQKYL
jgi:hypothetical protein